METKRYHIARKYFDGRVLHKAGSTIEVPASTKPPRDWTELTENTVVEELQTVDDRTTAHRMQHANPVRKPGAPPKVEKPRIVRRTPKD